MTATMATTAAVAALAAAFLVTMWRWREGGLLRLAIAVVVISPVALVAALGAAWSRWRLARPACVRRILRAAGCLEPSDDCSIAARRISKGCMNAVILVMLTRRGRPPRQLVLKHLLRFGTLVGWTARQFGATPELPRRQAATARCAREVRALLRLRRRGFAVPACLGHDIRRRFIVMEYLPGAELAPALGRDPRLVDGVGRLLARMHAAHYSMGDANPQNMAVDGAGRLVSFDLEHSLFGDELTPAKVGFDLAWAGAFLAGDDDRERLLTAYGPRSAEVDDALAAARRHIARFSPLVEWYGRRWRGEGPGRPCECRRGAQAPWPGPTIAERNFW